MNTLSEIAAHLRANDDYVLVGHERPDHDSLGSMLGLYFGLSKLGKKCKMISSDPLPANLSWPGLNLIEIIPAGFDPGGSCVIVLDCEPHRTGGAASGVKQAQCLINIDHHQRPRGSGDLVFVDASEAATAVIIYRLLRELPIPFDADIALVLYGGILGDTGGFRHANTDSEVLRIAAELLEFGLKPAELAREIFSMNSLGFLKLLGHALSKLETAREGQLVWTALSLAEYRQFGVNPHDQDHLINCVRSLDTAEIAIVFRETEPERIRIAFRANRADVSNLARRFGGGGHRLAAGATVEGNLQAVVEQVTAAAGSYLAAGEVDERNS